MICAVPDGKPDKEATFQIITDQWVLDNVCVTILSNFTGQFLDGFWPCRL